MLERVDLDRIAAEAEQVHFRRVALTLLVGLFWLVGFVVGTICRALWAAAALAFAAIKVGWQDAQRPRSERTARRMRGAS